MSKLIYITNTSLDGYVEDETGAFDWVDPDQVFEFITELVRPIGTYLYGRRLYETMAYWEAPVEGSSPERREFARRCVAEVALHVHGFVVANERMHIAAGALRLGLKPTQLV